ncbi:MAG: hypothetical protein ABIP85_19005, partial [Chthoniobacteraceae bacterium]
MRWTIFLSAIWMFAGCSTPISIRERHHRDKTEPEEWLSRAAAASDSGDKAELRRTIGRFIVVWNKSMSTPVCGFRIVASPPSRTIWDPHYFDGFKIADDIDFRGLPSRHVRDGIGTPLVGWRDNLNRESIEKLYPPEGISRPVTAVLKFGPRPNRRGLPREVTVMLLKSQVMDSLDGRTLAADFSAPWAALLSRTKALRGSDLKGLLRADHTGRDAGMFLMEPYDPAKTPVVMVHGLLSTPLIWGRMTQELWADPAIRQRYQVWHYLYPTGLPFLYSAKV